MNKNVLSSATSSISTIIAKSPQILEATLSEIAGICSASKALLAISSVMPA